MDLIAIIGAIIGFAAIIGGNMLEGGQLASLLNTPAGVIVIGGTLGAVILQTPFSRLKRSVKLLRWVLHPPQLELEANIDKITDWSRTARKEGLLGLENIMDNERDAFTKKGLALLIDAAEPHSIRRVLESELEARTDSDLAAAQVFKSMGGYSPTIGIIGAVLQSEQAFLASWKRTSKKLPIGVVQLARKACSDWRTSWITSGMRLPKRGWHC